MSSIKTVSSPGEKMRKLFVNRNFALLWSGQAISKFGDVIFNSTLVFWIASDIGQGQQWAPLALSGVFLAAAFPVILLGPLAGVFVDRWEKRRTMLWMDMLRAFSIMLLLLISVKSLLPFSFALSPSGVLAAIYLIVFIVNACTQFFDPARLALIGNIVPEPSRPYSIGLLEVSTNLAVVVGPPLAALLFFRTGVQWALGINVLSFVASFLTLRAISPQLPVAHSRVKQHLHFLHEFSTGLLFLVRNRVLMTLLITPAIGMFGISAFNTLGIFFVLRNLHTTAASYSFISTAFGAGAIGGAFLAGTLAQRLGIARTFWLSIMALSCLLLIYSRLTAVVPAIVISFLFGIPNAAIGVAFGPLLLQSTPVTFIGRVSSTISTCVALSSMISSALVGYLASVSLRDFHAHLLGLAFSSIDTIFTLGSVAGLLAGIFALVNLRGLPSVSKKPE